MNVLSWLLAVLGLAALLTLAPGTIVTSVYADDRASARAGSAHTLGAASWRKDVAFRLTDQLSAQTQAAVFPRHDVAFSLTHRVWARAPEQEGEAARQELAWLRLSQQVNPSGPPEHAFTRLAPAPVWADLLLEARAAPVSRLQLSTTAAYHPAGARLAWATAELRLQPLSCWTLSLAPEFGDRSQLERLTGRMQLTLPGAWTVAYAMHSPALDVAAASHTVTTRYRSSYGTVRLQLSQSSEERRVGVLLDVATFLRRTLGF
jgi:hypothetical protein